MKMRCLFGLLFSITLASSAFGEDIDSRLKALEDRASAQEKIIGEQQKTIESLQTLQGGGHDPRKRGFTVQNIELSRKCS